MRAALLTAVALCLLGFGNSDARPPEIRPASDSTLGTLALDVSATDLREGRPDTLWFGGDDGSCVAFEGGVWDWDTGIPPDDPLQCWTAIDQSENPAVYFGHATTDSFAAHGDPCAPIYDGGMLWCGIHEDEADERDFEDGMGYQNGMRQYAFSPELAVNPETATIDIEFLYFNDTEPNYDYTHVYLRCYDIGDELIEEYGLASFTGVIGSFPSDPAHFVAEIAAGALPPETETIQIELRMLSDGGYSDEDGGYDSVCGPFGIDDVMISVSDPPLEESAAYDFGDGPQGWTFAKGEGAGVFVDVVGEETWQAWVDEADVDCHGHLHGNALAFVDMAGSPYTPPGLPPESHQVAYSGPVARGDLDPEYWNGCLVEWDMFAWTPWESASTYRMGYSYYPYTSDTNPEPHWSPRMGEYFWESLVDPPICWLFQHNFTTLDGINDEPLTAEWESLKVVLEVYCSCAGLEVDSAACDAGDTRGSPVIDNVRVGLTHVPDAPMITRIPGGLFQDGFGQSYPDYLEPSDRGNSNISRNLYAGYDDIAYLGDSAVAAGPGVTSPETRWLAELCFHIPRTGPRQEWIPGYGAWKTRLGVDPEHAWVCALMDSMPMAWQGSYNDKFATYFHEDDPRFDPTQQHYSEAQEILPDDVFVPGTRIEYYMRSFWYNDGAPPEDYYTWPIREFEILPTMMAADDRDGYDVVWPSVLYIDAATQELDGYVDGVFELLGIESYDRYDYQGACSCCSGPLARQPIGNNGCTLGQLLGYRLIFLSTGLSEEYCLRYPDHLLLQAWLNSTDCAIGDYRRGIICDGNEVARIFVNNGVLDPLLGIEDAPFYTGNPDYCVDLAPPPAPPPPDPTVSLYANDADGVYTVLEVDPAVPGAFGNLVYLDDPETWTEFASVRRDNAVGGPGQPNWRSVVHGFSFHRLYELGCDMPGDPDSAAIVQAAAEILGEDIAWILEGSDQPFVPWRYPCDGGADADEETDTHLSGRVNFLYAARPNPFTGRASLRFHLAAPDHAALTIHDVLGRRVRTLVDDAIGAGEHNHTWDGTDEAGRRLGAGLYWMQLECDGGYRSSKRMIMLR